VRAGRTWGTVDMQNQVKWESLEGRPQDWGRAGWRVHLVLMVAALGSLAVAVRRRAVPVALLVAPVVVTVVSVVGYGNQRFRAAAEPSIAIAAATALVWLASAIWRRWRLQSRAA
jgi:hypothetical protein